MQGRVGSGERKGREAGRRAVEGKPERRKNKVKRGKRKEKGRGEGAGGRGSEERDGGGSEQGAPGRSGARADPACAPWAAPGAAAAELRGLRNPPPPAERDSERGKGEARLSLNPACTVCAASGRVTGVRMGLMISSFFSSPALLVLR